MLITQKIWVFTDMFQDQYKISQIFWISVDVDVQIDFSKNHSFFCGFIQVDLITTPDITLLKHQIYAWYVMFTDMYNPLLLPRHTQLSSLTSLLTLVCRLLGKCLTNHSLLCKSWPVHCTVVFTQNITLSSSEPLCACWGPIFFTICLLLA